MTISLNWLKQYIDIPLSATETGDLLTAIGLEVEGMEETESIPGGLRGVVVGQVVECGPHPNADRLSLTKVNIGSAELLQIVCGAPNVAAGQKVFVATIGTMLHPTQGEPFEIKQGKIRGEVSEGMICAEDELGLGTEHAGIIVLPADTAVGLAGGDYYGIAQDVIYEIGLTPNRSDATAHLGVAEDLAAALRIAHSGNGTIRRPDVSNFRIDNRDLAVSVEVRNTEACPRYSGISIQGVTVGESPDWLKQRLLSVGVRPINNIVDITNFVLHELGQPLHAFDLAKVTGQKIIVETLPAKTTFTSLDEVKRQLSDEDLMICDGQEQGMCIAGVFGGIGSGVTRQTTDIFLESAHFEAKHIRRTSMRHNLRTDAAKVYEKGSDPNITVYALKRAAQLMHDLAGGKIASEIVDIYPQPILPVQVRVRYQRVNQLIGLALSPETIADILSALQMDIVHQDATSFTVAVPTNKADVTREVDVIEEILRIYGFNNVPMPERVTTALAFSAEPDPAQVRNTIADQLVARGYHEMMALSLSESRYYEKTLPTVAKENLVFINNTSNVHLDIMRPTMLISGLEAILHNQNHRQADLSLFEFGRTYRVDGEAYSETDHLSLFLTGRRYAESWLTDDKARMSYYTFKTLVIQVLDRLRIEGYQITAVQDDVFAYGLKLHRGSRVLVSFGRLANRLTQTMSIKSEVFYADFDWDNVLRAIPNNRLSFSELHKFPGTRRDLALVVDKGTPFADIAAIAGKTGKKLLQEVNLFDVYTNDEQLGNNKKSYAVSFEFVDPEKTLRDKDIDKIMQQLIYAYEKMGATIRR